MPITNREQLLAFELIEELRDKRKRVFGMYMKMIKRYGEQNVRRIKSEVMDDFRRGKIVNPVKIFMYKIKLLARQK